VIVLERETSRAAKNDRVISGVSASMAFEGLEPSTNAKAIGKQYLEDKISSAEAIAGIKASHASKFSR